MGHRSDDGGFGDAVAAAAAADGSALWTVDAIVGWTGPPDAPVTVHFRRGDACGRIRLVAGEGEDAGRSPVGRCRRHVVGTIWSDGGPLCVELCDGRRRWVGRGPFTRLAEVPRAHREAARTLLAAAIARGPEAAMPGRGPAEGRGAPHAAL